MPYKIPVFLCRGCQTPTQILNPILAEREPGPGWTPRADFEMLYLCHICVTVCKYTAEDFRIDLVDNIDPDLTRHSALVAIRFQCDVENCDTLATVFQRGGMNTTEGQAIASLRAARWDILCVQGHGLLFRGNILEFRGQLQLPLWN